MQSRCADRCAGGGANCRFPHQFRARPADHDAPKGGRLKGGDTSAGVLPRLQHRDDDKAEPKRRGLLLSREGAARRATALREQRDRRSAVGRLGRACLGARFYEGEPDLVPSFRTSVEVERRRMPCLNGFTVGAKRTPYLCSRDPEENDHPNVRQQRQHLPGCLLCLLEVRRSSRSDLPAVADVPRDDVPGHDIPTAIDTRVTKKVPHVLSRLIVVVSRHES